LENVESWSEYNEDGDYAIADGDAHRPTVASGEVKQVKKVCIKVLV